MFYDVTYWGVKNETVFQQTIPHLSKHTYFLLTDSVNDVSVLLTH